MSRPNVGGANERGRGINVSITTAKAHGGHWRAMEQRDKAVQVPITLITNVIL